MDLGSGDGFGECYELLGVERFERFAQRLLERGADPGDAALGAADALGGLGELLGDP